MPTRILRITHIQNLAPFLASGSIASPNHSPLGSSYTSIAHSNIQSRRSRKVVPVGPGGTLHDYVPFYFGARSPMLYANHRGYVSGNPNGQAPIIYLVAYAEDVAAAGLGFAFTDGHAEMAYTAFYDDLAYLPTLDWQSIYAAPWWNDTPQYPDRKRKKQSEFLVHEAFPLNLLREIAVLDDPQLRAVGQILAEAGITIPVQKRPDWYY